MQQVLRAVAALGLALFLTGCADAPATSDPDSAPVAASGREDEPSAKHSQNPTTSRRGPLSSGSLTASCVEEYAPDVVVADRSFAFDGTVLTIGPSVSDRGDGADLDTSGVAFKVHEWFAGGDGDTVIVDMQIPLANSSSASDEGYSYGVGSRLLVSGEPRWGGAPLDAPIAWSCGFSRYYDAATAVAWRDAARP